MKAQRTSYSIRVYTPDWIDHDLAIWPSPWQLGTVSLWSDHLQGAAEGGASQRRSLGGLWLAYLLNVIVALASDAFA